jgi:glycosyltransferase involved in cell wall biosynthesis
MANTKLSRVEHSLMSSNPAPETANPAAEGLIGIVSPYYAPHIGGVEKHVEELAQGFKRQGIAAEIITTDATGQLPAVETVDGIVVRRFPTLLHNDVFLVSPTLGSWLSQNARRYSLIHAHSYHTPLALQAAFACRRDNIPFVVTPHYHGTGHTPLAKLLHKPYTLLGRWMLRQADAIFCVSGIEENLLNQHFPYSLPTRVIPNGVDADAYHGIQPLDRASDTCIILAAGRLEHYKRTVELIAALPYLPAHYRLVIVGDGPARETLQQRITALHLEDRVQLLGYVPRKELVRWFCTADVFVSLSTNEAFGMTVLEAAYGGAVVVASDIPAHREVCQFLPADQMSLVPLDESPGAVARVIQQATRVTPRHQPAAQYQARIPTWKNITADVLQTYQQLIAGSRAV